MSPQIYDIVIIGSGPGGYVAAIRAAQLGFKTACVEKRKTFGGTCLNVGCIPSKALLQSSEHYAFLTHGAATHGINIKGCSIDFKQMMKRKDEVVHSLVNGVGGLLQRNKVDTYHGEAAFISPNEISITEGKERKTISGKYIILATGSESIELPFLKIDETIVLSSTGALSLPKVPKKMLVIGAGVIGVELASVYSRLGSEVTIIEMLDMVCPAMDRAISKTLLKVLKNQGMIFHLSSKVIEAEVKKNSVSLQVETGDGSKTLTADVVLVSIGRRPFTKGLGLGEIGIETNKNGFVKVDASFRTTQNHIFAIGDITEGPMLAHRASEEGVACVEVIAGETPRVNYAAIPNVIYTHPEAAALGFTEEEAREAGISIMTGTSSFKGNPRARCSGDTEGLVKVIGEKTTGRLIGMHIIGPNASEIIGEGVLAVEMGATVEDLANASHAHPTLCESIKEAALNALGRAIHL